MKLDYTLKYISYFYVSKPKILKSNFSEPERIQAGIYLLFYTLFASLPLLIGIFYIYKEINFIIIYIIKFYDYNLILLYLSLIFAFLLIL